MSIKKAAKGTLLKRGDGGVGAGTKASKTFGTVNQQLKIIADKAGTTGNSLQAAVVVAGLSTALSVVMTANSVTVNSATDGAGVATTTVLQAIAALYATPGFTELFDATTSTGTGSGVLVAGALGVLSGGTNGTEIFSTVPGITNLTPPQLAAEQLETSSHDSGAYREYIPMPLKDAGEVTAELFYDETDVQHEGLLTDLESDVRRNWQVVYPGGKIWSFAGYVLGFEPSASFDGLLTANVRIKIDGAVTRS